MDKTTRPKPLKPGEMVNVNMLDESGQPIVQIGCITRIHDDRVRVYVYTPSVVGFWSDLWFERWDVFR